MLEAFCTTAHPIGRYRGAVLGVFVLFMVAGNFFRLIPLGFFPNYISIVELLLYALALPLFFCKVRKSFLLVAGIALSSIYGALLNGFDLTSSLYGLKLIGMIASAVAIGESFASGEELGRFLLRVFTWVMAVGFAIFLFFPKAHLFFAALQGYGIRFCGDPHQRRFISPFFDPNYYAAIACLPLVLAWVQRRWTLFGLIFFSLMLTFSRSGIATCGILLVAMALSVRWKVRGKGLFFLAVLAALVLFSQELSHLIQRSMHMGTDLSALARLETFRLSVSLFWERPFWGVGYHYLSHPFFEATHRFSPDSSLLMTLIDFGLIPCLGMAFVVAWWSLNHFQHRGLFFWVYFYVAICILLTSLFNNLLYYPYWFIPVGALLTQMGGASDGNCTGSRLAHPNGGSRKGIGGAC